LPDAGSEAPVEPAVDRHKPYTPPEAPLSGQGVITREIVVADDVFTPGHLGELTRIVTFEMVDAVLAGCGAAQQRPRKLPARVVVCLLPAAALFEDCGYPAVWRRLTATLGSLPLPQVTATALGQARPGPARQSAEQSGQTPR